MNTLLRYIVCGLLLISCENNSNPLSITSESLTTTRLRRYRNPRVYTLKTR